MLMMIIQLMFMSPMITNIMMILPMAMLMMTTADNENDDDYEIRIVDY